MSEYVERTRVLKVGQSIWLVELIGNAGQVQRSPIFRTLERAELHAKALLGASMK